MVVSIRLLLRERRESLKIFGNATMQSLLATVKVINIVLRGIAAVVIRDCVRNVPIWPAASLLKLLAACRNTRSCKLELLNSLSPDRMAMQGVVSD